MGHCTVDGFDEGADLSSILKAGGNEYSQMNFNDENQVFAIHFLGLVISS